jgi:hypothetical protein
MMEDMGQQHATAHPTHNNDVDHPTHDDAADLTTDLPVLAGEDSWQQPPLLVAPDEGRDQRQARSHAGAARPTDRLRQVGLVGIARARTALAEATRRADEARAAQQETKAA